MALLSNRFLPSTLADSREAEGHPSGWGEKRTQGWRGAGAQPPPAGRRIRKDYRLNGTRPPNRSTDETNMDSGLSTWNNMKLTQPHPNKPDAGGWAAPRQDPKRTSGCLLGAMSGAVCR
jgi:hypothetical protein